MEWQLGDMNRPRTLELYSTDADGQGYLTDSFLSYCAHG